MKTLLKACSMLLVVAALGASLANAETCHLRSGSCYTPRPVVVHRPIVVHRAPVIVHEEIRPVVYQRPVIVEAPPVVAIGNLQLVEILFVDPGFPEQNLGPRYRVVIKNASPAPIAAPFDLVLAASAAGQLDQKPPLAAKNVLAMGPEAVVSFDIRLPMEAMAMAFPGEDRLAPFSHLFILATNQLGLSGQAGMKKLGVVGRIGLPMVDLAIAPLANATIPAGTILTLAGEGFGLEPGQILLELPGLKLNTQIVNWGPLGAQLQLPDLALADAAEARLIVIRNDGQIAPVMPIQLIPAPLEVAVEPLVVAPVQPQPQSQPESFVVVPSQPRPAVVVPTQPAPRVVVPVQPTAVQPQAAPGRTAAGPIQAALEALRFSAQANSAR